jgi:predicted outer membrane repeat protein
MRRFRNLAFALVVLPLGSACATTIAVTSTSGAAGVQNECVLRDAITSASFRAAQGGCLAGTGDDTIVLPGAATITLSDTDNQTNGRNGLPIVYGRLTIEGGGATIERSAPCGIYDAPANGTFRFFLVASFDNAVLKLHDLTLRNGCALDDGVDGYSGSGGAVLASGIGTLFTDHVMFTGNTATNTGGALYLGALKYYSAIVNTSLAGNSAGSDGGALATGVSAQNSALQIVASTFRDNTAAGLLASSGNVESSGGALRLDCNTYLRDVSVFGNYADDGGGIAVGSNGILTIEFSTVAANTMSNAAEGLVGGGLWVATGGKSLASDSIIAGNSGGDCYTSGATLNVYDANLASDGSCPGFTLPAVNPKLGAPTPAGHGLPTDVLPLLAGSPAIDASTQCDTNGFVYPDYSDERGQRRPFDGDGNGTRACDLGAYEVGDTVFRSGFGYYDEY